MTLWVRAVVVASALALPQMAHACAQLSQHVWMCDRGTAWETAQWDQFGDGATLILGDVALNFTEEWPGHEISDDSATLEENYATYIAWIEADGVAPVEVMQSDVIETGTGRALRYLQRDAIDGVPTLSALMLAQVAAARIMLYLDGPGTMALADMDSLSRGVLDLLRDNCADEISCADDYQPPLAAQKE